VIIPSFQTPVNAEFCYNDASLFPMGHPVFFYTLAAGSILGCLGVILSRHPVYATLSLVATLFSISGLFVLLGAYFVAMIQILVYAGAILVLFLFVVMLLDMAPDTLLRIKGTTFRFLGTGAGLFFLWKFFKVLRQITLTQPPIPPGGFPPVEGTTQAVGKLLFTTYALPFEVASLLLLVGVIGAVVLAKKKL